MDFDKDRAVNNDSNANTRDSDIDDNGIKNNDPCLEN